jgi:3-dehydroquinate dehydratase/shikimate dehydrogenase
MAKVCLCLTGSTIEENLRVIEKYREVIDMVELRVDFLSSEERYHIRKFPELAGLPAVLTVRRPADGGHWDEGEGARVVLIAKGLAFADSDPRKNFAYIDLESDVKVPSIEEAARTFGTRIIRSFHDMHGMPENCAAVLRSLPHHPDEIAKIAVRPRGLAESLELLKLSELPIKNERIVLGMGESGLWTRILTERLESLLTFTSAIRLSGIVAAPGQIDPFDLREAYNFNKIDAGTTIYAILGSRLPDISFAARVNQNFAAQGKNAVAIPLATDNLRDFFPIADALHLAGAIMGSPFRYEAVKSCQALEGVSRKSGLVTAIRRCENGWMGADIDSLSFAAAMREFMPAGPGRKRACVFGSGAQARSTVAALNELGYKCLVTDRAALVGGTAPAGQAAPTQGKYIKKMGAIFSRNHWIDGSGISLRRLERLRPLIVKMSGAEGTRDSEELSARYGFSGRERVADLSPGPSHFLERAKKAGCATMDNKPFMEKKIALLHKFLYGGA